MPSEGLHADDEFSILYVGIAPRASAGSGRDPLRTSLAPRIAYHYTGGAEASALRTALGIVLSAPLGLRLRLHEDGERFHWGPHEPILSQWMQTHMRVRWLRHSRPWEVSDMAFRNLVLPLNLAAQDPTPFQRDLSARQASMQADARAAATRSPEAHS
ncbi:MAG: hypothetical protein DK306_002368 [Chloroflexi bacterium]|nr:MAG: hypothetical protein DK306_002368 [Chloroflexota bacterium]